MERDLFTKIGTGRYVNPTLVTHITSSSGMGRIHFVGGATLDTNVTVSELVEILEEREF